MIDYGSKTLTKLVLRCGKTYTDDGTVQQNNCNKCLKVPGNPSKCSISSELSHLDIGLYFRQLLNGSSLPQYKKHIVSPVLCLFVSMIPLTMHETGKNWQQPFLEPHKMAVGNGSIIVVPSCESTCTQYPIVHGNFMHHVKKHSFRQLWWSRHCHLGGYK